ncbi:MFS transporter [Streptomyces sp. Go40/10]|uniref:MFS transporter n=1 Tax=Streptomyces sp. Go40/10 TaxID=2825844 RepID=UPI001E559924|nr:MFS transporter [Streptomyces sp. Go40/10]UFR06652.1 MFS transporter [Streptomyces sp. Go40/10]
MKRLWAQVASFDRPARLLMVNQFAINLGFYMLMPYLADHLAHGLGLAAWAVGLVLGVRNFSQQGMFLVGGTLADRYGCKPMILTGCALRAVAFGLLAVAGSLPALVAASALTGLAGALFNPAVRAYLAADAGQERRVAAFAAFNVFYQAGILVGPLAGLALLAWDFSAVCTAAALIFGALAALQSRALPARPPAGHTGRPAGPDGEISGRGSDPVGRDGQPAGPDGEPRGRGNDPAGPDGEPAGCGSRPAWRAVVADWRSVAANRPFLLFAAAMSGSYVLSFQVYLALPLYARTLFGDRTGPVTGAVFAASALAALAGQLKLTAWAQRTLTGPQAVACGLAVMGAAFLPLLPRSPGAPAGAVALTLCAVLLAWGGALLYPFEMDTVVRLSGERLVATYYGAYSTASGIAVSLGNLAVGALFDTGVRWLPWAVLTATGLGCAALVARLHQAGHLRASPAPATG